VIKIPAEKQSIIK